LCDLEVYSEIDLTTEFTIVTSALATILSVRISLKWQAVFQLSPAAREAAAAGPS